MILARDDGSLYYETHGEGDTVIFLNGFASGISTWYPVIKRLKKSYKCILYDYIGTGESRGSDEYVFALDSYRDDLSALIDTIGKDAVHLVGYSMGGWIAQYFTARHTSRVKSLVLINSSSRIFSRQNWIISHFIDVLRDSDITVFSKLMFISYYSPEYFEKNGAHLDRIKNLANLTFEKQQRENWEQLLRSCLSFDEESSICDFEMPVLSVTGTHDFLCPRMTALRFDELIPGLKWLELESAGHAIPMECFKELREAIDKFLHESALRVTMFDQIAIKRRTTLVTLVNPFSSYRSWPRQTK